MRLEDHHNNMAPREEIDIKRGDSAIENGDEAAMKLIHDDFELPTRWDEFKAQLKTAWPTLLGMLLYKVPWLISLRFVGGIGADELTAAALASTLCNVTGLSLSVGLSSALTTLTGQARGHMLRQRRLQSSSSSSLKASSFRETEADSDEEGTPSEESSLLQANRSSSSTSSAKPLMPLVFMYRGMFVQLMVVIPVGLWWLYGIEPLLIRLGQNSVISNMTQDYLRILTPGLWSYSVNWTLTTWLQTLEMADVPAYAAACGLLAHVPLNYLFIYGLGWGYLGCAAATVAFQLLQPIGMIWYLQTEPGQARLWHKMGAGGGSQSFHCSHASTWSTVQLAVSKGIGQYLGLALPGIVSISEWWASEVAIFLSGRFENPTVTLGAMTLYQSINSACFMFPIAFSVSGATRVSTWLGAGQASAAARASWVSVLCAASVSAVMGLILYRTPHTFFPSLFAPSEVDLYNQAGQLMPLLALYVFADGIQSALNGTMRGCGKQALVMPVVVVAYWLVGLPLAYHWAFNEECSTLCGDVGLVSGMTTGTWTHMILLAILVWCGTDWPAEARKAHARITPSEIEDSHENK